jgi:AcrR family transcriptional regulator
MNRSTVYAIHVGAQVSIRSGGGDPSKTLALLWREERPAARGPKPSLHLDDIVAAALRLADDGGIDGLSMRTLATELGMAPMALYRYVPGKAELVDLMLDSVYASMRRRRAGEGWRGRLEAVAHDNRALHERHPWLGSISTGRPPLGPGVMAKYEYELGALEGCGLSDVEMDAALTFVLGFVASCARAAADERAADRETQMNDEEWWRANEALLQRVLDPTRYPLAARVGAAAGEAQGGAYDAERMYRFGLARVLDGIAALIEPNATANKGERPVAKAAKRGRAKPG